MKGSSEITPFEYMIYRAATLLDEGDVVFTGTRWPVLVTRVAMKWHAPGLVRLFESGMVNDSLPEKIITSVTDFHHLYQKGTFHGTTMESLYGLLRSGFTDSAMLDASNVDRFGNVNTSVIGDYESPRVRLPGSGGSTEVGAFSKNLILLNGSEDPRRYPDLVDYRTVVGRLGNEGERTAKGYDRGTGPQWLVSPLGLFRFQHGKEQISLTECSPDYPVGSIRRKLPWDLDVSGVSEAEPPHPEGLKITRAVIKEARERGYVLPNP